MTAPIRCPSCGAVPTPDRACPECRQDLSSLMYLDAHAALHYNEGLRLAAAGEDDRAVATLTQAVAQDATHVDALVVLGKLHARAGRYEQAGRAFDDALALDPSHRSARAARAALPVPSTAPERAPRPHRRLLPVAGVALLAVGAAGGFLLAPHPGPVPGPGPAPPTPGPVVEMPAGQLGLAVRGHDIVVSGLVPDTTTEHGLLDAVRASAGGRRVVDAVAAAPGASTPSAAVSSAVRAVVAALVAVPADTGLSLMGSGATLSGTVPDEASHRTLDAAVRAALPGTTLADAIAVGPAAEPDPVTSTERDQLRAEIQSILAGGLILYGASATVPTDADVASVQRIAELVVGRPGVIVQVDGYSDPVGSRSTRQLASIRRAAVVRSLLMAAGVSPDAVVAVGRADTDPQPTAAASRRVVISIRS